MMPAAFGPVLPAMQTSAAEVVFAAKTAKFGMMPSESALGTMLKVLKWGVVPLDLKGHDMTPHSS